MPEYPAALDKWKRFCRTEWPKFPLQVPEKQYQLLQTVDNCSCCQRWHHQVLGEVPGFGQLPLIDKIIYKVFTQAVSLYWCWTIKQLNDRPTYFMVYIIFSLVQWGDDEAQKLLFWHLASSCLLYLIIYHLHALGSLSLLCYDLLRLSSSPTFTFPSYSSPHHTTISNV